MLTAIIVISGLFITLGIGAFVSDYILPNIKPLNDFMKNLPMFW